MAMENVTTVKWSDIKSLLVLICIMMLSATLIVLVMPNTEKPRLTYTVGEPWMNMQLISPGEILIQKDNRIVEQEQQEALRNEYVPYFRRNDATGTKQTDAFLETYHDGVPGISPYVIQLVASTMKSIYQRGIMSSTEYSQYYAKDSTFTFMLASSNQANRTRITDVYTTKTAYETLFADKRLDKYRDNLRKLNLDQYLHANISYDESRSNQARQDIISMVPTNSGMMKLGQEIINRGEIVTEEKARMIDSYNDFVTTDTSKGAYAIIRTNGTQWLYVMMLMGIFVMYMHFFRRDYMHKPRSLAMAITLLTLFPILNALLMHFDPRTLFLLPVCLVPMFIRVFLDSRTAATTHIVMVLICAASVSMRFDYIVVQIVAGITTICALRELSQRSQLFTASIFITLSGIVAVTIVRIIGNQDITFDALKSTYFTFLLNGLLLLLAYPLMYLVEKTFGFISPVTLFELSDSNNPLLRRLSEIAPGTYQHSVQVSNLASAIATEVGAKSLLVRTGALYHDIGKMQNPVFFTENQAGINPHTRMTPKESAQIIIGHVTEGLKLAEKHGVPDVISNFIGTHHGSGVAKYFYNTYRNAHPDEEVDPAPFQYPGPNPFSREQAILMMADCVEAAARSLPEYTEESITNLVNKIIDAQVAEGYFKECPITFRDIDIAKRVLIGKLKSMYHTRIQYPELK